MKSYSAIILAAGYSSRMGSFKPLMNLMGKTPLQRCVELFIESGMKDIVVVTGYLNQYIEKNIKDDIIIVKNASFNEGMFSSIKVGVLALPEGTDAFFILPADIPTIKVHTIKKMMEGYEKIEKGILHPVFAGVNGHPVLIPYSLAEEIVQSNPEGGLRDILNRHKKQWYYEQAADRGILLDMDTKEDFKVLQEHVAAFPYPDYEECMEILRLSKVNQEAVNHMQSTAELARKVTTLLNEKGYNLNVNYAYAGALLHDAVKGKKDHADQGAVIAEDFGYGCLSEIISENMELKTNNIIGEKEIVYLCDKLIKGVTSITLEEGFANAYLRYAQMPNILKNVNKKYNDARLIKENVEKILGKRLETLW